MIADSGKFMNTTAAKQNEQSAKQVDFLGIRDSNNAPNQRWKNNNGMRHIFKQGKSFEDCVWSFDAFQLKIS